MYLKLNNGFRYLSCFFLVEKNVGRQAAPSELFRETLVHKTVLTELGWGIRETKTILGLNLNGH